MGIDQREAQDIVNRTYRRILEREPDEHAATWAKMVSLGVFDESRLREVFRLSTEYLQKENSL